MLSLYDKLGLTGWQSLTLAVVLLVLALILLVALARMWYAGYQVKRYDARLERRSHRQNQQTAAQVVERAVAQVAEQEQWYDR